jgi:hypothetical protein
MVAKVGEALVNAGHVSGKYSKILGVLACERALWKLRQGGDEKFTNRT